MAIFFEQLMIQIESIYDGVGFTELQASLAESQTAMTEFDATNVSTTAEVAILAEANMAKATGALNQFELEVVASENIITQGLAPSLMGLNTSCLEQMCVDMEMAVVMLQDWLCTW
jgi:hypothetical protein